MQPQGRLKNLDGELVESSKWNEAMAGYYAAVQWMPPPLGRALPHGPCMGQDLPLELGLFTQDELEAALAKLKTGKAAGPDEVPPDLWKAVRCDAAALQKLLELCNNCWAQKAIPQQFTMASLKFHERSRNFLKCS